MKKAIITITTIALLATSAVPAMAQTKTTPTPTGAVSNKLDQQINQLKEKIASRVSELNLVEKRGFIGVVSEVKGNQITLTDLSGNVRYADVDEITKFSSPGAGGSFGISDLTKGTQVSVLGIYNKQSKRILARFIKTYAVPMMYSGAITSIDQKNFQVTVATPDQKQIKVDVDTATKVSSYEPAAGLARYGFSKLAVGDRVTIAGAPAKTDANLFAATRMIVFLGLPKDPKINVQAPVTTTPAGTTVTPTTPTNRNLNPIR